ncbi:adenine deaminase [Methanolobus sp. ZRKC3]|uniref:adenine deaminase n=1 Tax=Methanolobus sp. ZRKC3 TaxID=3125786 RepID=UPI00324F567A
MRLEDKIFAGIGMLKADTILENCRIVNVNTKEILAGDVAIKFGYIVGIGDVSELKGAQTHIVDINNRYLSPGLIDGHVHFESSMVTLSQFTKVALAHGTTGVVIDPHEIANVLGRQGIELVLEEARTLPLNVFVTVSSCVPATVFETSGAKISAEDAEALMDNDDVIGLAEMMDYPDVLRGDKEKIAMIDAALKRRLLVDGHCPGLRGSKLGGYMCAGASTDHESIEYEEALEKLRLGMKLMVREGSAAKSLDSFLPRLIEDKISLENVFFITDDNHPGDLIHGYMDAIVKKAIILGLEPLDAISMCTTNTAKHYRIEHLVGSISIGRKADFVILDNLEEFKIHSVFAGGTPIKTNKTVFSYPDHVFNTIKYKEIAAEDLQLIDIPEKTVPVNVIKVFPDKILTEMVKEEIKTDSQGFLVPDIEKDILSTAVIERHGKNGNIGRGFITGLNLKSGALGQSIAHDSHNVIVTGTNYSDMALCANTIRKMNGGIVLVQDNEVLDSLPLPFAGLLSMWPIEKVNNKLENMHETIRDMGCTLPAPFITHSFIALPVIPDIRLTDMGLFDVKKFELIIF